MKKCNNIGWRVVGSCFYFKLNISQIHLDKYAIWMKLFTQTIKLGFFDFFNVFFVPTDSYIVNTFITFKCWPQVYLELEIQKLFSIYFYGNIIHSSYRTGNEISFLRIYFAFLFQPMCLPQCDKKISSYFLSLLHNCAQRVAFPRTYMGLYFIFR